MSYKFAANHNSAGSLADVNPQPKCKGIKQGTKKINGNGGVEFDGYPSTLWEYTSLTSDQLNTLLTAFGLTSVNNAECTITTSTNQARSFSNFNATVNYPELEDKFNMGTWNNVIFEFARLVGI